MHVPIDEGGNNLAVMDGPMPKRDKLYKPLFDLTKDNDYVGQFILTKE
jgi:hypothetical protein